MLYACDYLRLIDIFWITSLSFLVCVVYLFLTVMIVLYTVVGNVTNDTVKDSIEWASCSFKSFLKNSDFVYIYICVNITSYVLISYEEGNLLKYSISEWLVYIYIIHYVLTVNLDKLDVKNNFLGVTKGESVFKSSLTLTIK